MKLIQYSLFALICALASAQVPSKCIVPVGDPIGETAKGSIESAREDEALK